MQERHFYKIKKNSSDNDIEFGQYLDQEYTIIEPSKQPKLIELLFLMQLFKQSDHCDYNMVYSYVTCWQ